MPTYIRNTYIKRRRRKNYLKLLVAFLFIFLSIMLFLYQFDNTVMPTIMAVANAEMRAKSLEIVNQTILEQYSKSFNYDEIIHIEKDEQGNITILRADTLKMNKIACDVALSSQNKLKQLGEIGIKVPMGYIFKNNIFAYLGPSIKIKMQPIGSIETQYLSQFESAGINQTRHRIYVILKTNIRVVIPLDSNDLEVKNEVPIAETIIVGKIPDTSISLDLKSSGFKIDNK